MRTAEAGDGGEDDEQAGTMTTTPLDHDGETREIDDTETIDDEPAFDSDGDEVVTDPPLKTLRRQINWSRALTYGLIPAVALTLTAGAGYLKLRDTTNRDSQAAQTKSVQAARDSTVAFLSYTPADVDKQLVAARDLLTGDFRNSYTSLTNDVVIPGAKQQQITAVATVPAAASVSASVDHAVTLVFVNQTTTVGNGAPTSLASTVRITLDKNNGRWLISEFDPV